MRDLLSLQKITSPKMMGDIISLDRCDQIEGFTKLNAFIVVM